MRSEQGSSDWSDNGKDVRDRHGKIATSEPTPSRFNGQEAAIQSADFRNADQEVEFTARGLVAGATYTLVVDGREVETLAVDLRGRIASGLEVPLPGAASSR